MEETNPDLAGKRPRDEGGDDEPSPKRVEVVEELKVESQMAGLIMGPGGKRIQQIQNESGARVHLSPLERDSDTRTCVIRGLQESVDKASAAIKTLIEEEKNTVRNVTLKMTVPRHMTGAVIGKRGARVRQVEDRSGAKIRLVTDDTVEEPTVIINGVSQEQVDRAKDLIEKYIIIEKAGAEVVEDVNFSVNRQREVLGASGEIREEIEDATGAFVRICGEKSVNGEVCIRLSGTREEVNNAKEKLERRLNRESRGSVGRGGVLEGVFQSTVYCPDLWAGSIIGERGSIVRSIVKDTGAEVKLNHTERGQPTAERTVSVNGPLDCLFHALTAVLDRLCFAKMDDRSSRRIGEPLSDVKLEILLPDRITGGIIGKKGANVRRMEGISRCKITCGPRPEEENGLRTLTVTNDVEDVLVAINLIIETLVHEKVLPESFLGALPPPPGDRYGGDRYGGDRYGGDRYGGDRYGPPPGDRYGGYDRGYDRGGYGDRGGYDRGGDYGGDRYGGGGGYGGDRYGGGGYGGGGPGGDRYGGGSYDRYGGGDRYGGDRYGGDRGGYDRAPYGGGGGGGYGGGGYGGGGYGGGDYSQPDYRASIPPK